MSNETQAMLIEVDKICKQVYPRNGFVKIEHVIDQVWILVREGFDEYNATAHGKLNQIFPNVVFGFARGDIKEDKNLFSSSDVFWSN